MEHKTVKDENSNLQIVHLLHHYAMTLLIFFLLDFLLLYCEFHNNAL